MKEYLVCLTICMTFYLLYKMIVVHGTKWTYAFFVASELVLIISVIKSFSVDATYIFGQAVLQIAFIVFVKDYGKNKERNMIFDMLAESQFMVLIFNGIDRLKNEDYDKIKTLIENYLVGDFDFVSKIYLLITFEENELTIRYLFSKREDYDFYVSKKQINIENAKEMEYAGQGVSMIYTYEL